jgi:biotin carboxyl carrier protein
MKYIVKIENHSFSVEVGDIEVRPIIAVVDGTEFEVWPVEPIVPSDDISSTSLADDKRKRLISRTSFDTRLSQSSTQALVRAPIPGTIDSIAVQDGTLVKRGQELCILEAMKMKNVIRAPRDGIIRKIHINIGQSVKHQQSLMEYEG